MMTREKARQGYYDHSGKASDVARQLGFAGIAIIWLFHDSSGSVPKVPEELIPALALLALGLLSDLVQYVIATVTWLLYMRRTEKDPNITEETKFDAPFWINWPFEFFFWLKFVPLAGGYLYVVRFLFAAWT